ncbi:hypothetical protein AAG590_14425 [Citromicrobium bathyomarinum]
MREEPVVFVLSLERFDRTDAFERKRVHVGCNKRSFFTRLVRRFLAASEQAQSCCCTESESQVHNRLPPLGRST